LSNIGPVLICSSSIGRAAAMAFRTAGFEAFATARNPTTLEELRAIGCRTLALDVTDEVARHAAVEPVERQFGTVRILVNNAGYGQYGPIEEISLDDMRRGSGAWPQASSWLGTAKRGILGEAESRTAPPEWCATAVTRRLMAPVLTSGLLLLRRSPRRNYALRLRPMFGVSGFFPILHATKRGECSLRVWDINKPQKIPIPRQQRWR